VPKLDPRTEQAAREIGEQIRQARERAELSQEEAAKLAGMTRTNYARIEYGKTNVTLDTLRRISEGFGVEVQVRLVRKRMRAK
jgi:transcriptional regulator with XRE-family HTH domain